MGARQTRQNDAVATKKDRLEGAALARRILSAVEQSELEADTPAARRLLRRLEGATAAWEAEAATHTANTEEP